MYKKLIRPILFMFSPEAIHKFTFFCLKIANVIPGIPFLARKSFQINDKKLAKNLFGIEFPNSVGLAAGLDKDAEAFDMLGNMGFGFVEIGTVTPKAQLGNPKPRIFRLKADNALINRMGFNNKGVGAAVKRLKNKKTNVIIGGNIGKNKVTPNNEAINDYCSCFEALYPHVDYFAVNISSPNTPNLRDLQEKEPLKKLLNSLQNLNIQMPKKKPILLKIAPDLNNSQLDDIIEIVSATKINGIIATNTTVERKGLSYSEEKIAEIGIGGLSGKPLKSRSTEVISYISKKSEAKIPIIAVGGIMSADDAVEKLNAGASLVQLYTAFIYEAPSLIKRINKKLLK